MMLQHTALVSNFRQDIQFYSVYSKPCYMLIYERNSFEKMYIDSRIMSSFGYHCKLNNFVYCFVLICRYVICKNLLHGEKAIFEYLKAVNDQLNELKEAKPLLDVLNVSRSKYNCTLFSSVCFLYSESKI